MIRAKKADKALREALIDSLLLILASVLRLRAWMSLRLAKDRDNNEEK